MSARIVAQNEAVPPVEKNNPVKSVISIAPEIRCGLPDADYIHRSVPIDQVARALNLDVVSNRAMHCWRYDAHRNGDRKASVWFSQRSNRGKCQVCDSRSWDNIDLVKMVAKLSTADAIRWIDQRFGGIPRIPKGKHLAQERRWSPSFRVGTGDWMESLVRSGMWASMSHAELRVLGVLRVFYDPDKDCVTISYIGIMQFAGLGSSATVAQVLRGFERLHILERLPNSRRDAGSYRFTLDDVRFLDHVERQHEGITERVKVQRAMRAERRKERQRRPCSPPSFLPIEYGRGGRGRT